MTKWTFFDKLKSYKIHWPLRKWQNSAYLTKLMKRKNTPASQKVTKLAIFDSFEKSEIPHGPLRKWQNWAFLTKLKKQKNTRAPHKLTKWSIFDKIVWYITTHSVHIVYLYLSHNLKSTFQNDKMDHFWQNWKCEKIQWPLRKWKKLSIFDTIDEAKKYMSLSESDKMGYFWQFW